MYPSSKGRVPGRYLRVNRAIRMPEVRVIDENGGQLGILKIEDALRIAYERGFDLIEIVPTSRPPVCKLADYGKYKYEEKKKHKHSKINVVKELKVGLNIQEADKQVKIKQATKFLEHGDKVLVKLWFKGREIIYNKRGQEILWAFGKALESIAIMEQAPRIEGKMGTLLLAPKPNKDAKVKSKDEESGEKAV